MEGPLPGVRPDGRSVTHDPHPARTPPAGSGTSARRAARNIVVVVAGELVGKSATLVFTIVVARALGATSFGSLSFALAFGLLLATLVGWGFDAEQIRRGSADRSQLDAALTQTLVLRTIHAVPVVLLGGLAGVLTRPGADAAATLVLVLLASVLDSYGDAGRAAATALEKLSGTVVALVAQRVAACVLAVVVLETGGGLVEVGAAYLLSSVLGQAVLALLLRRMGIRLAPGTVDRAALVGMWRGAFLIGVEVVLSMALFRLDALMLGLIADDREVASYAVAYRLMETVLFVNWAVSRSLFPAMVRAAAGAQLLRVGASAISVAGAVLVPYAVLVAVDGGQLLRLLFGSGYGEESVVSLRWLAFAPVLFAVGYLGSHLLVVQRRTWQLLATTVSGVITNVALNIVVIPLYGARGAAAATTGSYLVEAVAVIVFVRPGNGLLRMDLALGLAAAASVPMVAVLLALSAPVLVEVAVACAVYLLAYLLLVRWRDPGQLVLLRSVVTRS